MKAIKEVTYYCKKDNLPLADERLKVNDGNDPMIPEYIKTGNLVCPKCRLRVQGNKEFVI